MLMDMLTQVFCEIDDFYLEYEKIVLSTLLPETIKSPAGRHSNMHPSEVMAIIVMFHSSGYRTLKHFYLFLLKHYRSAFPNLVSYNRFVELMSQVLIPLLMFLHTKKGRCTGISFIDSTVLKVCHIKRAGRNRVFDSVAKFGKSTMGWFLGFKLHLIINDKGELLAFKLTPGNIDDRKPVVELAKAISGKLFGDKGYISQNLLEQLLGMNVKLITPIKSNMKNKMIPLMDKLLLRKRSLIETVNDQLKNICQIEHTRHRSICNFMVNVIAGLVSYCFQPKKPALKLSLHETRLLENESLGALAL